MPLSPFQSAIWEALDLYVKEEASQDAIEGDEVVHYTTMDGLIGILRNGNLFAGNLIAMNDASEFQYARNMLVFLLRSLMGRNPSQKEMLAWMTARAMENEPPRAFVTSFTSACDATTHWQGYAGRAGFALHFDKADMVRRARAAGYLFGNCKYKREEHEEFIKTAFLRSFSEFERIYLSRAITPQEQQWVCEAILYTFGRLAPLIKHQSFSYENEWRCWRYLEWGGEFPESVDLRDVHFFEKSGMLTGRVNLDLSVDCNGKKLLPLRGITIGPSPTQDLNSVTLHALLHQCGYSGIWVERSASPYRHI